MRRPRLPKLLYSSQKYLTRPLLFQTHDAVACGLYLVTPVDADGEHSHPLNRARAVERARINRPETFDEFDRFHHARFRLFRIARDKDIAIELRFRVCE